MNQTSRAPESVDPLWYKDAVIYQMHVKAFHDSNGDGIGDFAGLAQKLDYIEELGVNTIWLLPFYPSPLRDDGYDIADYTDVHPDYGTLDDFRSFIAEAHRRGLKVITELVINHTSEQHPWFQRARRAPAGSPERNFYVWSDTDQALAGTRIIFTDTENSNWAWDPVALQYYWHRFFSHQPDLNHNNPAVVDAVIEVMRFWLDLGVDGMRLDAIPYLCVREGSSNENLPETHDVLKRMRAVVDANYEGRMFLAEANQWPEDVREYFGDGDECHVAYHFPLMPRVFMAVALEDRYPIAEIMRQTPDIPENCQWAIFLRNHDELTLEMVTDKERDYMYRMYAQEPRMRVNVGIRRRLAPLLRNDVDRIKLMNSLLLSMPGSPIIYYGDEIGMGDNIYIGDRNGVRTPMQWSVDRNAGFSRADPQRLYLPLVMDPIYGYQAVNVEAQSNDPSSLLNWTRRILTVRRGHNCFGRGALDFIRPQNRKVLAYVRTCGTEVILCVANLAQTAQSVELDLTKYKGRVPVELLGRNAFPPIGDLPYFLTLPAHAFFWLQLSETAEAPPWHVERMMTKDPAVLVMPAGLDALLTHAPANSSRTTQRALAQLEQEILPEFMRERRWFAAKGEVISSTRIGSSVLWTDSPHAWLMALVQVQTESGLEQQYFLPLSLAWEDQPDCGALLSAEWMLAKNRTGARTGALIDAFADPQFCLAVAGAVERSAVVPFGDGEIRFTPTHSYGELASGGLEPVQYLGREQSNTSVVLGERLFLKGYRQSRSGTNPDMEVPRFLTHAGFKSIPAVAGAVEYVRPEQPPVTLAALFAFVRNQGDGWAYTLSHLERFATSLVGGPGAQPSDAPHTLFLSQMETLGHRVGEMHATLAIETADEDFRPEPIAPSDVMQWREEITAEVRLTLDVVQKRLAELAEPARSAAQELLERQKQLSDRLIGLSRTTPKGFKTRYHGDLHLGQVLLVADDFLITDFEGEPARSIEERRRKSSPVRDVAGMLRSFDYARAVALDRASSVRPDLAERLKAAFDQWHLETRQAFIEGYRDGASNARSVPTASAEFDQLVALFEIQKALYEVRYELANRPQWLAVPARGLLALLGTI